MTTSLAAASARPLERCPRRWWVPLLALAVALGVLGLIENRLAAQVRRHTLAELATLHAQRAAQLAQLLDQADSITNEAMIEGVGLSLAALPASDDAWFSLVDDQGVVLAHGQAERVGQNLGDWLVTDIRGARRKPLAAWLAEAQPRPVLARPRTAGEPAALLVAHGLTERPLFLLSHAAMAPVEGRLAAWRRAFGLGLFPAGLALLAAGMLLWQALAQARAARGATGSAPPAPAPASDHLFDHAPEALVLLDERGRLLLVNARAVALFGRPAHELLGRPLADLLDSPPPAPDSADAPRPLTDTWEAICHSSSGERHELRLRQCLLTWHGRRVTQVMLMNLTSLRQRDRDRQHQAKLEALATLANGVAHDFNNLLTIVSGYAELTREEYRANDTIPQRMDKILEAARRGSMLTTQMLTFARSTTADLRLVDTSPYLMGLEPLFRRLLDDSAKLVMQVPPELPPLLGDEGQLGQALINLVVNARTAMPTGGTLTVSAAATADETGHGGRRWLTISVSDTGVGIPPEHLSKIFEPFFTTREPGQGTGLGLSTAHGIVTQHGGRLTVRSEVGHGTVFTLHLPVRERPGEAPTGVTLVAPGKLGDQAGGDQPAPPVSPVTILVVEDEHAIRELLRLALGEAGHRVVVAATGEEALCLLPAHEGELQLALVDLHLPGIQGPEVVMRLRERLPSLRVAYISGLTNDAVPAMLQDPRCRAPLIQKPFTPAAIRDWVAQVLRSPTL